MKRLSSEVMHLVFTGPKLDSGTRGTSSLAHFQGLLGTIITPLELVLGIVQTKLKPLTWGILAGFVTARLHLRTLALHMAINRAGVITAFLVALISLGASQLSNALFPHPPCCADALATTTCHTTHTFLLGTNNFARTFAQAAISFSLTTSSFGSVNNSRRKRKQESKTAHHKPSKCSTLHRDISRLSVHDLMLMILEVHPSCNLSTRRHSPLPSTSTQGTHILSRRHVK